MFVWHSKIKSCYRIRVFNLFLFFYVTLASVSLRLTLGRKNIRTQRQLIYGKCFFISITNDIMQPRIYLVCGVYAPGEKHTNKANGIFCVVSLNLIKCELRKFEKKMSIKLSSFLKQKKRFNWSMQILPQFGKWAESLLKKRWQRSWIEWNSNETFSIWVTEHKNKRKAIPDIRIFRTKERGKIWGLLIFQ